MITLTVWKWVPDFAQGLVRELRVRWACEEAGVAYREQAITFDDKPTPAYRARQPFGQVPVIQDGDLTLFESGAILLHIAEKSEALMPRDANERARATAWVFAALNSIEIFVQDLIGMDLFSAEEDWYKLRRPGVEAATRERLDELANWLGDKPYLEGDRFTAGDLMMASVLDIARTTDLVTAHPVLGPYLARCKARPAYQRALNAHMNQFAAA